MKAQRIHHGLQRWEVGQEGRAEAAPCRILAPAKGLLPGSFPSVHSPASAIHTLTDSRLLLLTGGRLDVGQH